MELEIMLSAISQLKQPSICFSSFVEPRLKMVVIRMVMTMMICERETTWGDQ
jgi:hypothetical protein